MTQYVHPDVREMGESGTTPVTLVVVPIDGERDRVERDVRESGGTVTDSALNMLEVELPADAVDTLLESDYLQSVAPADTTLGDLGEGNLTLHQG